MHNIRKKKITNKHPHLYTNRNNSFVPFNLSGLDRYKMHRQRQRDKSSRYHHLSHTQSSVGGLLYRKRQRPQTFQRSLHRRVHPLQYPTKHFLLPTGNTLGSTWMQGTPSLPHSLQLIRTRPNQKISICAPQGPTWKCKPQVVLECVPLSVPNPPTTKHSRNLWAVLRSQHRYRRWL